MSIPQGSGDEGLITYAEVVEPLRGQASWEDFRTQQLDLEGDHGASMTSSFSQLSN